VGSSTIESSGLVGSTSSAWYSSALFSSSISVYTSWLIISPLRPCSAYFSDFFSPFCLRFSMGFGNGRLIVLNGLRDSENGGKSLQSTWTPFSLWDSSCSSGSSYGIVLSYFSKTFFASLLECALTATCLLNNINYFLAHYLLLLSDLIVLKLFQLFLLPLSVGEQSIYSFSLLLYNIYDFLLEISPFGACSFVD
jgi:hypothetical protein